MPETRSGKKKLLIILGAGSSVELGMPSVGELDRSMRQWAREQADEKKSPDFFGLLWEIRRLYAAEIPADDQRGTEYSQPNYERCLGDMPCDIRQQVRVGVAETESALAAIDAERELVMAADGKLAVQDWLEEEALLALPLLPRCMEWSSGICPVSGIEVPSLGANQ